MPPRSSGHFNLVELLLARGAEKTPGARRLYPPSLAAKEGHSIVASMLIEHGANINVESDIGLTPLDLALEYGRKPGYQRAQGQIGTIDGPLAVCYCPQSLCKSYNNKNKYSGGSECLNISVG